jgi:hypothetical protein
LQGLILLELYATLRGTLASCIIACLSQRTHTAAAGL